MALLLSLAITFTFMPADAFAVEGNDAAIAEEAPAETVIDDSLEDTSEGRRNISMPDEEELLEGFLLHEASETAETKSVQGTKKNRGSRLTGNDKVIYDELKKELKKVASGDRTSTVIDIPMSELAGGQWEFTADDLGVETVMEDNEINPDAMDALVDEFSFDSNKVIYALLADMPYDLYWFDKTIGYGYEMTDTRIRASYRNDRGWTLCFVNGAAAWSFYFCVSRDYSKSETKGTTDIDTGKTGAAKDAAENAGNIVSRYPKQTTPDKEKLTAYKDEICRLASYDYEAMKKKVPYGNIWQMIYVFDNDPDTKVVCEGYSKAFQFLCDISDFNSKKIRSGIADGDMKTDTVNGPHMWNIVHMDDNRNYLVDVTNCDEDGRGGKVSTDLLFLKGCTPGTGACDFECAGISYTYSKETRSVFAASELELSEKEYTGTAADCTHVKEHVPAKGATCTTAGNTEYWHCSKCNLFFADADGNEEIDRDSWVIPASHKMKKYSAKRARCETNGRTAYWRCSKCNKYFSDKNGNTEIRANSWVIPATGHSYGAWRTTKKATETVAGQKVRNCTVCGAGEVGAVAKLKPSLPAVSIKKPAAAKKAAVIKWKKLSKKNQKKIASIQIQYSTDKNFRKGVKTATVKKTAVSKKITKLKSKKKYYVRIRAYKKDKKGVHVSKWSKVMAVKIK